jgi:peptide/nickel transport system ATP-binding protein
VGLTIVALVIAIAALGPMVAPYSPTAFFTSPFAKPSGEHWVGTDYLGRDVLSRVLHGGSVLLIMAALSTVVALILGSACGIAAGYLGGRVDAAVMRCVDIVLVFPNIVLVLMLISMIGPELWLIVLAVGFTFAPGFARVLRASTLDVAERGFVEHAVLQGIGSLSVMRREIFPNLVSPLMVQTGLSLTYSIMLITALDFIGFGQAPPAPSWGAIINENRLGLQINPWAVVVPAALIALLTVGTNVFTDAVASVALRRDRRSLGRGRSGRRGDRQTTAPAAAGTTAVLEPIVDTTEQGGGRLTARLEVRDLTIALADNGAEVVQSVSFVVREGEVLGLVGESGSGKTTVALALLGFVRKGLRIKSGGVFLDGVDLLSARREQLRDVRGRAVSYVPQDPAIALNPALKIGTQLREQLRAHREAVADDQERLREVLMECRLDGIRGLLDRYPHQLSGGQQQRIALAIAFMCRPSLIVLDEPTTGLDVSTQRHLLEVVRSLCSTYGVAAVYVSHDLAVVAQLVSRVTVMYAGRIIESGPTSEVFGSALHPYTRGLLAALPSARRAEVLSGIAGQAPRPGLWPPGCSFAPRCRYAIDRCASEAPEPTVIGMRVVRCFRALEKLDVSPSRILSVPTMSTDEPKVLTVAGVSAAYASHRVLTDIDLEVRANHTMAIVGESGSGKTTLARCIVGLHPGWTGTIRFRDLELELSCHDRSKDLLRRIQYIGQNPYDSLNPRRTVAEILGQPLEHFFDLTATERADRIATAMSAVALSDQLAASYPGQLSGGESQRIAIARALIVEPDVLVCDEITSALDVSVQAVIVELLRRLQRERRIAMIFITHNLALVRSIAESVVVLSAGRAIETGDVEQVLEQPHDPYTIRLVEDVPGLEMLV